MRRKTGSIIAAFAGAGGLFMAAEGHAEGLKGVTLSMSYKVDVMGVANGGQERDTTVLDNLSVNTDVDLDAAAHWRGASLHVSFLANHGGHPGDLAGSLQGVDNIEVVHSRAKVYEAWIDQSLANGLVDVRAGLYDTNSEFNVTDSAGIFLGPTYGISSEIAATGPNGPSIFPSPALAMRVNVQPRSDVYVRFAVVNAMAGTLGDPGGVNTDFSQGVILWGEAGWKMGGGKIAGGAWGYTKGQPDLRETQPTGDPKPAGTHGAYLLVDEPVLKGDKGPQVSAFLRFGVSDGDTTPYRGAGAVGLVASHLVPSRPDGVLALGFSWGTLSAKYRANSADAGEPLDVAESAIELTYADKLGPHLTLQPDLQYIHRPSGDPAIKDALVLGLRAAVTF